MQTMIVVAIAAGILWPVPAPAQSSQRETPAEMRRIVAQAICLGESYPGTAIATDSVGVVSVYQGALGATVSVKDLEAVRALARAARPAEPTPVGNRNLAIARCVLFAGRPDVRRLLGEGRTPNKR
jgi:hypothetical protein